MEAYQQSNIPDMTQYLISGLYAELEEILLCVMAAGIPANMIMVDNPKMVHKDHIYHLECNISFGPSPVMSGGSPL